MKKKFTFCLIALAIVIYFSCSTVSERLVKLQAINKKNDTEMVEKSKLFDEPLTEKETVVNMALAEAPTTESFETSFYNLSEDEIKLKLLSSEVLLKKNNFFRQANSEEGMNHDSALKMVELMRARQALNKIILDRKLDGMRMKYL